MPKMGEIEEVEKLRKLSHIRVLSILSEKQQGIKQFSPIDIGLHVQPIFYLVQDGSDPLKVFYHTPKGSKLGQ